MHQSYNESQANIYQGWVEVAVVERFILKFNTVPKSVKETKQVESLLSPALI